MQTVYIATVFCSFPGNLALLYQPLLAMADKAGYFIFLINFYYLKNLANKAKLHHTTPHLLLPVSLLGKLLTG